MTRTAIASLTAALMATSSLAWAQTDPSTPAPAPAPAPITPPPPTATPTPQPVAPSMQPGAQPAYPAAPMDPAAQTTPGVATAVPVEAPPPPAPPTGDVLYVIQALETVCLPLINKQPVKAVTKATGYKARRDGLTLKLEGGKSIVVTPPSVSNPTICRMVVSFGVDEWRPMVEGLNNWAYARTPPLQMLYQGYRPINGSTTTWSWEMNTPDLRSGLAFNLRKKADGSPAGKGVDMADVVFEYGGPAR